MIPGWLATFLAIVFGGSIAGCAIVKCWYREKKKHLRECLEIEEKK